MLNIDPEELKKAISKIKENQKCLNEIIGPFLTKDLSRNQVIELCQVGKFIWLLDPSATIVRHDDSPDFIISVNGKKIGLEHERVFNTSLVEKNKSLTKLFDDAAEVFKRRYPDVNILANIRLENDDFTFKKVETAKMKNEIADYVFSLITAKTVLKPSVIEKVHIMPHTQLAFCYNPGAYIVNDIEADELKKAVLKKEPRIDKYRMKSGIQEQWLLIVIGSASPDSFEFSNNPFKLEIQTKFGKVFLLEDISDQIWQLI